VEIGGKKKQRCSCGLSFNVAKSCSISSGFYHASMLQAPENNLFIIIIIKKKSHFALEKDIIGLWAGGRAGVKI
jgi:hypothetical protein